MPSAAVRQRLIGRLSPEQTLDLAIALPLRNAPALSNLVAQIYEPASSSYHHYLSPQQFTEQFGPDPKHYAALIAFAKAKGMSVTALHPNRTLLDVRASASQLEKVLHVRLGVYQHPTENRTFFAPDSDPSLDLAIPVLSISGLDDFVLPRPMGFKRMAEDMTPASVAYTTGTAPLGYLIGKDFRAAYAPGVAQDGSGEAVGIFALDGYYPRDIILYENLAGLPSVPLTNVLLNGFSGAPGANNTETSLDISMAISMAPGLSKVIIYEGKVPNDVLNRMATDNQARQLSCSWGFQPANDPARDQIFQQFAAQGQSFFQASGDSGAWTQGVFPPSDNPFITVVGGTTLQTTGAGGPWASETTWSGSGGGISTSYNLPPWQQGLNMTTNQGSLTQRNLPDVSAAADLFFWLVANNGEFFISAGTSASTPLWGGFAALANQQALASGQQPVGFVNPAIYAIGKSASYPACFHDVTSGNNTNGASNNKFFAVPGYDLCTGWGTPTGSNLISALIAPPTILRLTPGTNFIANGPMGGPFTPATQTYTLTNFGNAAFNWSVVQTAPWLKVTPLSGAVAPGGPAANIVFSLTAAATNLSSGTYTSSVTFNNQNDFSSQTRQFTLAVVTAPAISSQPVSQEVFEAAPASFSVGTGTNAFLSYQWQFDNGTFRTNLSDGTNISGATASTLSLRSVSSANAGAYSVVVSNGAGSVTSSNAFLSIVPWRPIISSQPTNQIVLPGQTVAMQVGATGSRPLGFQWRLNGSNLVDGLNVSGTTSSTIQIQNVSPGDAGIYSVVVSNALGSDTSTGAVLTVSPLLVAGVSFSTVYSFTGGLDGARPNGVTALPNGNLLGTTQSGGTNSSGTIFQITPAGNLVRSYSFTGGNDGGIPFAPLQAGPDGNYYGTTFQGGSNNSGEIFRTTVNGDFSALLSLSGVNGGFPYSSPIAGPDGNLYGTVYKGGAVYGTIYRLTTNANITTLYNFTGGADGGLPYASLTFGNDGNFYGTTYKGGTFGAGTIFQVSTNGLPTTLFSFDGTNGAFPYAGLIQASDGNFYGTTAAGGAYGNGVIFGLTPTGQYTNLYPFTGGAGGRMPFAELLEGIDGNLYGTTAYGGAADFGTVFRFAPGSGSFATLVQFDGFNGANPAAPLVRGTNGDFYGTTRNGGVNGAGVIFHLNYSGLAPQITAQPASQTVFVGADVLFNPSVVGSEPLFYEWRKNGTNISDAGNISGSVARSLHLSSVMPADAGTYSLLVSNPIGSIVSADATLQVTSSPPVLVLQPTNQTLAPGGTAILAVSGFGNFPLTYQWKKDGTNVTDSGNIAGAVSRTLTIRPVVESNSGKYSVILSNALGSATSSVATLTVVPVSAPGTRLATLYSFSGGADGDTPNGLAKSTNGVLFGTTRFGGMSHQGTVFSLTTNGILTHLVSFTGANGSDPRAPVAQGLDGDFYGTTQFGPSGAGSIFKMTTDGVLSNLYTFTGEVGGAYPLAALTPAPDGNLYGSAQAGGFSDYGTIFKVSPSGAFTNLYYFTNGVDGSAPDTALTLGVDGNFYGITPNTNGMGNVFKMTPSGDLSTFYAFANNGDGSTPVGPLIQGADGNLFGAAKYFNLRGIGLPGSVFKLSTNGALTTLYMLNPVTQDGANPAAGVIEGSDGNLYGTTEFGGPGGVTGNGVIYRVTRDGAYTTLFNFDGFNSGTHPRAALVEGDDGSLYGTTSSGGPGGKGTIFRLSMTAAPQITSQPASVTLLATVNVNFQVGVAGSPSLFYRWQKNGTNLTDGGNLSGSMTRLLTLTNLTPADAGTFSVIVTNSLGSATSAGAVLKVVFAPVVQTITKTNNAVSIKCSSIAGQRYRLQYNTNLTSAIWTGLGLPTTATTNSLTLSDASATSSQRFYRVVMLP